ncbi:MAG: trypsin-like peptidase domain-containing protein [Verrucomicrobiota bacterium]
MKRAAYGVMTGMMLSVVCSPSMAQVSPKPGAAEVSVPMQKKIAYLYKPAVVQIRVAHVGTLKDKDGVSKLHCFGGPDGKKLIDSVDLPEFTSGCMGSGFIISKDGYIITNGHVVQADNEELKEDFIGQAVAWAKKNLPPVYQRAGEQPFPVTKDDQQKLTTLLRREYTVEKNTDIKVYMGKDVGMGMQPKAYPAEVRKVSGAKLWAAPNGQKHRSGKDVAVIKIEADDLPTVRLGNSDDMDVGESIVVIGYPGVAGPEMNDFVAGESVLEPTVTSGIVSARKTQPDGAPVLQTDAATTHGNSGGPAFNEKGQVIGIATFGSVTQTATGKDEVEVQGFNFLVPMSVAKSFANELNVNTSRSTADAHFENGMNAYWGKDYAKAIHEFEAILRAHPGDSYAMAYRTMAEKAKAGD